MMNLLAWLYDRAYRVYEFFSWLYERIKEAARYAYLWARQAFYDTLAWAGEKFLYWYGRAVDWARSAVGNVAAAGLRWFSAAVATARTLVAGSAALILHYYGLAVKAAQVLVQGSAALMLYYYNRAVDAAQALVRGVENTFQALTDRFMQRVRFLIDTLEAEFEGFKTSLKLDQPPVIQSLGLFIEDPIGFIFGAMMDGFLTFLDYILGSAMGSVKYNLPSAPVLGRSGSGGRFPGTPGPSPDGGPLSPPLTSIRVSGHIYRPGHPGIDLGLNLGTPVYAMHDGVVQSAGWSSVGYGFNVVLKGGDWWTRYAHLERPTVSSGQRVKAGETVGLGNSTGNSSGNHLHLEIKYRGTFIDPLSVL